MATHTPLHILEPGPVITSGRIRHREGSFYLKNAHDQIRISHTEAAPVEGSLCRIEGQFDGTTVEITDLIVVHAPNAPRPLIDQERSLPLARAFELRESATDAAREFFAARAFLQVDSPRRVDEPGTDVHLDPLRVERDGEPSYLHTSPEFAMKELLSVGFERIWQLTHVWRGGEHTPLHHPEFTILEWYRAWENLDAIIDDVEELMGELVGDTALVGATDGDTRRVDLAEAFETLTMRQVIEGACGFDLLDALDHRSLLEAARANALLTKRGLERAARHGRWDELFFELQISHIDPFLAERGAVFVTEWPAELAVLARKKPSDMRVAERFELYVGGVEIANGFQELTDPAEQRARFAKDADIREKLGLPEMPMPERFLDALEYGLPPSSGVAVGFDRVLMLACGAAHIRDVIPYARQ
ncbi:MAG: EF-P lysine aminoacylase EpmA [Myxococcota bacterium]